MVQQYLRCTTGAFLVRIILQGGIDLPGQIGRHAFGVGGRPSCHDSAINCLGFSLNATCQAVYVCFIGHRPNALDGFKKETSIPLADVLQPYEVWPKAGKPRPINNWVRQETDLAPRAKA